MSLSDVHQLKELIELNTIKDEWLQESMIVCSPLDDFMVVASTTSAAFYVKKFVASRPEFQLCRHFRPKTTSAPISAVSYLPVKVEKPGRSSDLWHCVVIGYSSGKCTPTLAKFGETPASGIDYGSGHSFSKQLLFFVKEV